jgi:crotonobetainyl-CoA:carnitine CoA-transferase CaiB-like acyl-CoA transferase
VAAALDGLLVADFSRVLAGPLVGQTLGDLGADVVKVESPEGDDTRRWGPPFDDRGGATYFNAANRNKRSLVLDLRREADRAAARDLCERADVVVANFRPGTLGRFGLDHAAVVEANPRVVYCEITGFGEGAGRDMPGYDPLVQALGGLMSVTGPPETPSKTGVAIVDVVAGLYATVGVLAALRERESSGRGQRVTINLMHTALATLANQATGFLATGGVPARLGNDHPSIAPFSTYRAADGDLMIGVGNDRQFASFCAAIGADALAADARFAHNAARVRHAAALRDAIERHLAGRSCAEWTELLLAAGVPAGPVLDLADAFAFANRLGLDVVDDFGGVRTVRFPATLSRTPAATRRRPPLLGGDDTAAA